MHNAANQILDRCISTNDIAKTLAESGYPHGTWVSTRIQEGGRGRLGRSWQSIEGNLFLSVILRVPEKAIWSWIPLAVAVATAKTLNDLFPEVSVQIKWPNDLWLNYAKLGGILCEGAHSYIIVGLGLNCIQSPMDMDRPVINLTTARNGQKTLADDVRYPILNSILEEVRNLSLNGTNKIQSFYDERSVFSVGTEIEWAPSGGGGIQCGKVLGLGKSGELKVIQADGTELSLFAEDVRIRVNSYSDKIR